MSIEQTTEAIKKHWPWAVAIVGGVFLYSKFAGGGSSASVLSGGNIPTADPTTLAQLSAATQQAQIAADTANTANEFAATVDMGGQLASMNSDFINQQIALTNASAAVNIAAAQSAANISSAALEAGGNAQATYNQAVSEITQTGVSSAFNALNIKNQTTAQNVATVGRTVASVFSFGVSNLGSSVGNSISSYFSAPAASTAASASSSGLQAV
jgi:hypothetical protein